MLQVVLVVFISLQMFGEDYDEVVDAMSTEDKIQLKDKLLNKNDDEISLVANKLHRMIQIKNQDSIGSTVSPFSVASSTPSFSCTPSHLQAPEEALTIPMVPEVTPIVNNMSKDVTDSFPRVAIESPSVPESLWSRL